MSKSADVLDQLAKAQLVLNDALERQWNHEAAFKLTIPADESRDTDLIIGNAMQSASDEILKLRAKLERLREALEPFAKAADKADASSETAMRLVGSGHSDDCTPGWGINYGHVKAARAALERTP